MDKVQIFKDLASKSLFDVGVMHGFDKKYKKTASVKNAVYRVYNEVKNEPEKFNINQETVDLVVSNVSGRQVAPTPTERTVSEKLNDKDVTQLLVGARDSAARILHKKLERIEKSRKAIDNTSLSQLGTIFGILFDKGQIIRGQATQHVAHMAKIDPSLSPDEKLDLLIRLRERTVAEKNE